MRTLPAQQDRRARGAVAALFLTNGALFANLIPRYPEIKASLELDNTAYGLAIAAFPTGAIVAGLAAGVLIRRLNSAKVALLGTILTGIGTVLAAAAPSVVLFAAALFLAGAMDAITDVAQNAHGLRVQRRYGRSIINSFHAIWSVGAVLGGSMAALTIALQLPRTLHLGLSATVFAVVALMAYKFCLPGKDGELPDGDSGPFSPTITARFGFKGVLLVGALVLIAMAGTLVEDSGNSWAAIYLSSSLAAPAALAALGYVALVGAQFIGRILGDRLVDRFGQRTVARTGGLITAVGMGVALLFPTVPGTILGFAAAGLGVATLVPATMDEADRIPGLRPGTGLTIVSWLMRLGFLLSPPVVGAIADATALRWGLFVVPLAGIIAIVFAQVLPTRPEDTPLSGEEIPTTKTDRI